MRYLLFCLLILFVISICSCKESNDNISDGDVDLLDNLDNDSSDKEAFDPCANIDCSPGTCKAQESTAICECPTGYKVEGLTKCVGIEDGDVEKENIEKENECEPLYESGPFAGLCECDYKAENFPCIPEVEFNYTNDKGEFRIGPEGGDNTYGIDVGNGWIVFMYNFYDEELFVPSGTFLFNYSQKKIVHYNDFSRSGYYNSIFNEQVLIPEVDERKDSLPMKGSLWTSSLKKIERKLLSNSDTFKEHVQITEKGMYWLAAKRSQGDDSNHLYTFDKDNNEVRIDKLGNSILSFVANENWIVYQNGSNEIVVINLNNNTEKAIISQKPFTTDLALSGNNLYFSDSTYSSGFNCGITLWKYDLEKSKKEIVIKSDGYHDYYISDAWEDWILFENCDETFDETNPRATCCNKTNGDVYLHNVKTKEEWNISNHSGEQVMSRIWDNLIVWRDGRHLEKIGDKEYPKQDLYGIDLCRHLELKDKFPSCKTK